MKHLRLMDENEGDDGCAVAHALDVHHKTSRKMMRWPLHRAGHRHVTETTIAGRRCVRWKLSQWGADVAPGSGT